MATKTKPTFSFAAAQMSFAVLAPVFIYIAPLPRVYNLNYCVIENSPFFGDLGSISFLKKINSYFNPVTPI